MTTTSPETIKKPKNMAEQIAGLVLSGLTSKKALKIMAAMAAVAVVSTAALVSPVAAAGIAVAAPIAKQVDLAVDVVEGVVSASKFLGNLSHLGKKTPDIKIKYATPEEQLKAFKKMSPASTGLRKDNLDDIMTAALRTSFKTVAAAPEKAIQSRFILVPEEAVRFLINTTPVKTTRVTPT